MSYHLSNKTILITGANGFVGSFLLRKLMFYKNYKLKIVSRKNINIHDNNAEVILIKDLNAFNDWATLLEDVDYIFHLVGVSHFSNKLKNEKDYFYKINVHLTKKIAEGAAISKVKKIIFLSSIKVNGEYTSLNKPFLSTDTPNPQDNYGVSKLEAEKQIIKFCNCSNLKYTIVRPPLVYGPNAKGNFKLILDFIKMGIPLPFKLLNNQRSFISIYNLVDFLIFSIEEKISNNKVILVSDGDDKSISKMVVKINKYTKKNNIFSISQFAIPIMLLKIIFTIIGRKDLIYKLLMPLQIDKNEQTNKFLWKPKYTFLEGLEKTINEENF